MAGCVSAPLQIAGLEFVNETDMPITDVELRVEGTYEVASCSYISPRGRFTTRFPLREYRGREIEVVWLDRLGRHQFGPKVLYLPDPEPSVPMMAVITFHPAGRATGSFSEE
jgi:hypothetical protein